MAGSDTYEVTRSTVIEAPPSAVVASLTDFRRWKEWSPWEGLDPDLRRTYLGADAGVGAVYEWSGNRKAGAGRMEIVDVEPDRRVAIDLHFLKPFKSHSTSTFTLEPEGTSTRVTWTMTGAKTLVTRAMGIFMPMDKMIGPDFEKGLAQLKAQVEA